MLFCLRGELIRAHELLRAAGHIRKGGLVKSGRACKSNAGSIKARAATDAGWVFLAAEQHQFNEGIVHLSSATQLSGAFV